MLRWQTSVLTLSLALLACRPANELGFSGAAVDWQQLAASGSRLSGQALLPLADGSVRVQVVNASGADAEVRVTMRLVGARVHFAARQVPANASDVFIGPDRADSVLVEVTLLTNPSLVRPPLTYFYGRDFLSGDMIRVVINPEPAPPPSPPPLSPPPPPRPVEVALAGLDADIRVRPGMLATFAVHVSGGTTSAARVSVFADRDQVPASGDEVVIATDLLPADDITVPWTVPELPPARYFIYAEVRDGDILVRSAPAPGAIRVDAPPQLVFDSPRPNQAVTRGRGFIVAWAGTDVDDDAFITIFLDTNTAYAGNEPVLRSGIAANNVQDRQLTVDTSPLASGVYHIGGLIDDGLIQVVVYAGPICITDRLVGRFSPADLGSGEITTVTGGAENRLLGTALDISRRLAGPGAGRSTVLLSDPAALHSLPGRRDPVATGEVCLYQHAATAPWPRNLTINDMTLRMVGEPNQAATGQGIALLDPVGAENVNADILIGAPGYMAQFRSPDGRAYFLSGREVLALDPNQRTFDLATLIESPVGTIFFGEVSSATGLGVAALGDIDASGHADYAIGATGSLLGTGQRGLGSVYLFTGDVLPGGGPVTQTANFRLIGIDFGDLTGYAICAVADADGDDISDLAIGAPLSPRLPTSRAAWETGRAYLVCGRPALLQSVGGSQSLAALGTPDALDGRILAGEQTGDQAGAALAAGDFDNDGKPDLLIGAPGYGNGRGRVYLIYDVGNAVLPGPPAVIELGLVGTVYPGAVFDGLAVGDALGFAVASAGDFDADAVPDILLGAPGVESLRGAAYLVYGQTPRLQGHIQLTELGTCGLPGWELVGAAGQVSRLGASLSAGDLHGDRRTDLAIGAPGDLDNPGQTHLLFGRPPR